MFWCILYSRYNVTYPIRFQAGILCVFQILFVGLLGTRVVSTLEFMHFFPPDTNYFRISSYKKQEVSKECILDFGFHVSSMQSVHSPNYPPAAMANLIRTGSPALLLSTKYEE